MIEVWAIPHPGTGELQLCATFEECMKKWFEGYNIPRKVINGELENFQIAVERVRESYKL